MFAGFVALVGEERLPRRGMFGEMVTGEGYSGGHEGGCTKDLEEDPKAVSASSSKGGARPHRRRSADGSDGFWKGRKSFMPKLRKTEEEATAERHRQGGQGGASGLLSRLTPGCGHHRHDAPPRLK